MTKPCYAVKQLTDEMIRFSDTFLVGNNCPIQRINRVSTTLTLCFHM